MYLMEDCRKCNSYNFLINSDQKIFTQPRNLFVAGKNSQVTIIEHYVSDDDSIYFTNSVTEIVADENALLII
jgi:Fe-S cluster assembly protein SufD